MANHDMEFFEGGSGESFFAEKSFPRKFFAFLQRAWLHVWEVEAAKFAGGQSEAH